MSTVVMDERELERVIQGMEILLVAVEAAVPRMEEALQHPQSQISRLAEALTILKRAADAANEQWKPTRFKR